MKKIFTLILGFSFLTSLSAQNYCEDFEGFAIGDPIGKLFCLDNMGSKHKSWFKSSI